MEILRGYSGPEIKRVMWDILVLSKGSIEHVKKYVESARTDYRDVLYWAEYYDTDPLVQAHDPKKLAQEIINKWGIKN